VIFKRIEFGLFDGDFLAIRSVYRYAGFYLLLAFR
jgi:hypothetical protein